MAASDESAASKLIEVLGRIDTTLGALDRRLQVLEQSWPPAQAGGIAPPAAANANRVRLTKHEGFVTKHKPDLEGSSQLQEIIVEENDLVALLSCASSPCLDRHQTRQSTNNAHKIFTYPFTGLLWYRDVLKFLIHESERPDSELRQLYSDHAATEVLTPDLKSETAQLLACCDEQCKPLVQGRDENLARGVVRFDDLPSLFSPGLLLVGPGGEGIEQVVEVSSCDLITGPVIAEICVVQAWNFRWDGQGFSRTSTRFELSRYSGTRPIKGFPYQPVIGLDSEQSVARLREIVARNTKHVTFLQEVSKVEVGDYPFCTWESEVSDGFRHGSKAVEVMLDPAAFSLYDEERPKTAGTFGCYCSRCTSSISFQDVLRNARYLLLAPTMAEGFMLESKKWTAFPVRDLRVRESFWWDDETLDTVCFDSSYVELFKEKLTKHLAQRKEILDGTNPDPIEVDNDISRKAFVVQFHGLEGTETALTASSLANYCRRPALCITADDMGLEPEGFAKRLSLYAELGFRWGAVLIFFEADNMLQSRQLDDTKRNPLKEALARTLERFGGAMILLTSNDQTWDTDLVRYIRQFFFLPPQDEEIETMFSSLLNQLDPDSVESGDTMVSWVVATAPVLQLSVREIRDIFHRAVGHANRGGRKLALSDIIKAYTTTTGRQDEWDLVDDISLYGSGQAAEGTTTPRVTEFLRTTFGAWSELPDDGRLPFTFLESFYSGLPLDSATKGAKILGKATEELQKVGRMWIVDWGWPKGTWCPIQGCAYTPSGLYRWIDPEVKHPLEEWNRAGFTFGLRDVVEGQQHGGGSPWRRLVLLEGLSSIPSEVLQDASGALGGLDDESDRAVPTYLPWIGAPDDDRPSSASLDFSIDSLNRIVEAHVYARTLKMTRAVPVIAQLGPLDEGPNESERDLEFHIAFFHMITSVTGNIGDVRNTVKLFDASGMGMGKGCFTIFPVPSAEDSPPVDDPIHWTLICLTPEDFWPQDIYAKCVAPTLRAQTTYYVAEALRTVVTRWREVLQAIENLVDSDSVLRQPDQLQNILFDDDAFSTSKRYFWAINFIHEAVKLLDDSIQQWANFRKRSVEPWAGLGISNRDPYWYGQSQRVLDNADRDAVESCEELKLLRQEFQEKLDRITIMRDGLFNASAVMESRASTQLGQNVKLLTFVSIFFLPLGFCVAIWSINESYSKTDLAIVSVIVGVATYALTFNLNNVVHGLQKVYAPKRRKLIEKMEQERDMMWQYFGDRFNMFERSDRGLQKPSEWIILAYFFRRMWRAVRGKRDLRPEEMGSDCSLSE